MLWFFLGGEGWVSFSGRIEGKSRRTSPFLGAPILKVLMRSSTLV